MSMDLNLWLANGGVSLDGRKAQTPIVPIGWSARARHLADELDELLHGDLGEVTKQLVAASAKRPVNFSTVTGAKGSTPSKGSTSGAPAPAPSGYIAPVGSGQQTTYTGPVATASGGPVMPGAPAPKTAAIARATKGGGPVSAVQATKTYQTGTRSMRQTMKDLTGQDPLASSKQTMVASYGASPEEQTYVQQYNASQGITEPVQAAYVPATQDPKDFISSLIPSLTGGLVQALGGGPAGDFVGSLFGAGIGGPGFGTGDLPGALGRMNERYFGTPALPPAFERTSGGLGLTPYATDSDWQRMAALADHAGSTVARATLGVAVPELQSIRADLERRSVIESMERRFKRQQEERDFRREVLLRLTNLARMVAEHDARATGNGYGYEERRY